MRYFGHSSSVKVGGGCKRIAAPKVAAVASAAEGDAESRRLAAERQRQQRILAERAEANKAGQRAAAERYRQAMAAGGLIRPAAGA